MARRILWLKTKTTGLNANESSLCHISLIVEEDTIIIDTAIIKESQKSLWIDPPLEKIKELKSIFKK